MYLPVWALTRNGVNMMEEHLGEIKNNRLQPENKNKII